MMSVVGAPPASIGRYALIESIGTGGMAEVFRARGAGLGRAEREVAVKMVHAHLASDPEMLELFHREAQVASTLGHPNLVTVLESGMQEGRGYLVMEYVDGVDLRRLMQRVWAAGRPVPVGVTVAIAAAICAGLHHAHERTDEQGHSLQIVHRDVSPSNVLVSRDGAVKVSDFGVAKAMASWSAVHSAHGTIRGKLGYMAPEQARAGQVDRRADVFATGSVLFEMLAGHRPVQGDNEVEMLHELVYGQIPVVQRSRPDCPPSLADIVARALARDPDERWPTAQAMQQALERCALAEGCFVPPSGLADFVAEIMVEEVVVVEDDATTRVRDEVMTDVAAPRSAVAVEPTATIGDERGWSEPRPREGRVRARLAASLGLITVAGGLAWWGLEGSSDGTVEPGPVVEQGPATDRQEVDLGMPPSIPVDPPAAGSSDGSAPVSQAEEPSEGESGSADERGAAGRSRRPRRRPSRSRKPKKSTIDPGEALFPVRD